MLIIACDLAYLSFVFHRRCAFVSLKSPPTSPSSVLQHLVLISFTATFFSTIAFIIYPSPSALILSQVSSLFLPCTVLSLVSIYYLPRTLTLLDDFSFWLKLLHVLLVLPQIVTAVMPSLFPKMSSLVLYWLLALLIACLHWSDPLLTPPYAFPVTDCQLSISCDLVLCSLITVYAIYIDTRYSAVQASVALGLLAVVPPGVVLALHLARQQLQNKGEGGAEAGLHSSWVTWLQEMLALRRAASVKQQTGQSITGVTNSEAEAGSAGVLWMNLGQGWSTKGLAYTTACKTLATSLGAHIFKAGDGVLACGCGYGAELLFWKESFSLAHITGIDTNPRASQLFPPTNNVRLLPIAVSQIYSTFVNKVPFNRIVALDSVYHFEDKKQFFADCVKLLPPGGSVGVTDIVLSKHSKGKLPVWVSLLLRLMHVNVDYLWTEEEYLEQLHTQGWVHVQVKPFESASVLEGWFPSSLLQYLEYAVIVADRPPPSPSASVTAKPKVAIVGSGLSGLVSVNLQKLHSFCSTLLD